MKRRRLLVVASLSLVAVLVTAFLVLRTGGNTRAGERTSGYYTLVDETGNTLLQTGFIIGRGSIYIDPQNTWHQVTRIQGDRAETVVVPAQPASSGEADLPAFSPGAQPLGAAQKTIVIYHTHSDESYAPTDGADAIPANGGVYAVGDTLAASLTSAGFTVIHDRTAHDPHDGGAYPRSRRTVLQDLAYNPTFLFDLHRDAGPASEYLTTVGGVETARVLTVIGGANPLYRGNLNVANRLKATADSLYPGLQKGVLVGIGNYNQDLSTSDLILEFGSNTVPRPAAEHAATLYGNVVAAYLGAPGPSPPVPLAPITPPTSTTP